MLISTLTYRGVETILFLRCLERNGTISSGMLYLQMGLPDSSGQRGSGSGEVHIGMNRGKKRGRDCQWSGLGGSRSVEFGRTTIDRRLYYVPHHTQ